MAERINMPPLVKCGLECRGILLIRGNITANKEELRLSQLGFKRLAASFVDIECCNAPRLGYELMRESKPYA